MLFTIKWKYN